jgi:hypothetical protein
MGFGAYGVPMMAATAVLMNGSMRGGGIASDDNDDKPRKWYIKWFVVITLLFGFCLFGVFSQVGNRTVDVEGTVFAKGTTYKHHKHYDEQIFMLAITPDNPKWHKFDVKVTFATYSSYEVGDKVKFKDIRKDAVGDNSWGFWNELIMALGFVLIIVFFCVWLYFLISIFSWEK